ncbi:hypothetical protein SAMN02910356_01840 [Selenomonas sp. GACV-9]|uniref:tetratricopeptide repeat protein n=1 Tax=Selenomonas sp. GACV-9 TaxID=3158782 RepID=UPI0008EEC6F6|nr:hypothetical protein SAMN02910356_01840 [Selenomonas ruminantium]
MGRFLTGLLAAIMMFIGTVACEAAPQVITASGTYTMGENDSPKIAKDAARQEAMRVATEKAGVYVESYSKTQNMQLSEDDVKVISGAILKVTDEKAEPDLTNGVWRYKVTITAEVDTDNIDLKAMMDNRAKLEKLQKERDELKKQNEELLEKYRKAKGAEKDKIGTKLESQYDLGQVFDRCVAMIQRGEQSRAISELSQVIGDKSVTDSPLAYAYYLRGRAYYELAEYDMALENFSESQRTPHNDSIYPVWRSHYYRGLIYYDRRRWQDAYEELKLAWDASDHTDREMYQAMQRAEEMAYPQAEPERRGPSRQPRRPSGGGIDWGHILGEIITGAINESGLASDIQITVRN